MMTNHMNSKDADLNVIESNVDALQKDNNAKLKCSRNDEKRIISIIKLLIKTSTLKKEKSKDYS